MSRDSRSSSAGKPDDEFTYASYLHLDDLLALQQPRSSRRSTTRCSSSSSTRRTNCGSSCSCTNSTRSSATSATITLYGAIATFKRVRTVMKVMVEQVDIIETLTPMSFNSFRDRLETASGFQSSQFRELEFVLGYKRADMLRFFTGRHARPTSALSQRLQRAVGRRCLL